MFFFLLTVAFIIWASCIFFKSRNSSPSRLFLKFTYDMYALCHSCDMLVHVTRIDFNDEDPKKWWWDFGLRSSHLASRSGWASILLLLWRFALLSLVPAQTLFHRNQSEREEICEGVPMGSWQAMALDRVGTTLGEKAGIITGARRW